MGKNTLIIRFIDVALTVLFGFVGVSEIKLKTQIKLPNELAPGPPPDSRPLTVSVRIVEGPRFWLLEGNQIFFLTDQMATVEDTLKARYQRAVAQNQRFIALIEPDPDSPIQLTVDLLDICKRNSIPQNINYLENAPRD